MKTPHVHAELICAWAAGHKIQRQQRFSNGNRMAPDIRWDDEENPEWDPDEVYRIKPSPAYPRSTLGYQDLCDIVNETANDPSHEGHQTKIARLAADRAIAHFIESGGIALWEKECEEHGARD